MSQASTFNLLQQWKPGITSKLRILGESVRRQEETTQTVAPQEEEEAFLTLLKAA